ncbi:MAG: HAD-IIIA family hydrolase, partial [Bacteroidia bacterium]|nr:HAD-IIIA family hydrolase [Bacteroidia bacterium]NNJ55106.1 HAD-IIIA family hydrolase [Bacteroidia bacterium]
MILDRFSEVETFIFDVDGVLTDGSVMATDDGEMHRTFNIKDGFALQFAVKAGYTIIIISGGNSEGVRTRLKSLGIVHVHTAIADKRALLSKLELESGVDLSKSLYMGDDYPDISVMNMCGIKTCPNDAAWEIQDK